jgi:hypothetical protein
MLAMTRIISQAEPVAASPNGGGTPCTKITNAINAQYITDHQQIAHWDIVISTVASPAPVKSPLPTGSMPRGAFGTHFVNVSAWPTCA